MPDQIQLWRTGDEVVIGYADRKTPGVVQLASTNGHALMLGFEAMLGDHLGQMPVLLGDDGVYRSIMTEEAVVLSSPNRDDHPR